MGIWLSAGRLGVVPEAGRSFDEVGSGPEHRRCRHRQPIRMPASHLGEAEFCRQLKPTIEGFSLLGERERMRRSNWRGRLVVCGRCESSNPGRDAGSSSQAVSGGGAAGCRFEQWEQKFAAGRAESE